MLAYDGVLERWGYCLPHVSYRVLQHEYLFAPLSYLVVFDFSTPICSTEFWPDSLQLFVQGVYSDGFTFGVVHSYLPLSDSAVLELLAPFGCAHASYMFWPGFISDYCLNFAFQSGLTTWDRVSTAEDAIRFRAEFAMRQRRSAEQLEALRRLM